MTSTPTGLPAARTTHFQLPTEQAYARAGGLALLVLAAGFMTAIMLASSIAPGYDMNRAAISDLGVIPETGLLFNASLAAVGVLNMLGGVLLYAAHGRTWLLIIFLLAGLGALGAGLVPLDTSDFHSLFALMAFLFFNIEALGAAFLVSGPMRPISLLAGLLGLGFVVVMIIGDGGNTAVFGAIGHGGSERLIVYPVMLWMVAFGGYLMAKGDPAR